MAIRLSRESCRDFAISGQREWLLTNGIGGYAMGTVAGTNSRRYHGLLVAAVEPPAHRMVLLAGIEAYVTIKGESYGISANQYVGAVHPTGFQYLESFTQGLTVTWEFDVNGHRLIKRLCVHPDHNAITIRYENASDLPMQLNLRPLVCHKFYHDNFRVADFYPESIRFPEATTEIEHHAVRLTLSHPGADRIPTTGWYYRFEHQQEIERGLDPIDDLFCPCELRYSLAPAEAIHLVAAADDDLEPLDEWPADDEPFDLDHELQRAARKFLVEGPERKSIIAGYPWFTDWGRDTMISLPGLCLVPGKPGLAREILSSFAGAMRRGLIPNRFVDSGAPPEYNTADATLWFVNALYETLSHEWNEEFAHQALAWVSEIFEWHEKGTDYGIGIVAEDGLLTQGRDGSQLTWMDAKVGEWVVTPRHGKPVEVNGLWINALRIGAWLADRLGADSAAFSEAADKAALSFELKFWHPVQGTYLDTSGPDDASLRPNQLIAMSLPFTPVDPSRGRLALAKIEAKLLTPHGLRTLAPDDPNYHARFEGSLPERDAAYHQGTVWPWLIGPYVAACVRMGHPLDRARVLLDEAADWLLDQGLGGIAEVYDGDAPQFPGGCPWQAWSVAEVIRARRLLSEHQD